MATTQVRAEDAEASGPGLSAKVMNERWRKLLRSGIVERTATGARPPLEVEPEAVDGGTL
jgi:DNA-binding HxlR family transcriptional regulator